MQTKYPATAPVNHTFDISSVSRNEARLATESSKSIWEHTLLTPIESWYSQGSLAKGLGFHGLIEAAHVAFAGHYGLELAPDYIWLTITQGFANIINGDPEKYRGKFVAHDGKELIRIIRDQFTLDDPDNDWQGCFSDFSEQIRRFTGDDTHDLMLNDFSTTGPIERATSEMVLVDTVKSFFQYEVATRCGIPFITLRGDAQDWRNLALKARKLADLSGLHWWLAPLEPVFEEFVNALEGRINEAFWNSIYKFEGPRGSGDPFITGWLLKLIPYVRASYFSDRWARRGDTCPDTSVLPPSLSMVPFLWEYHGKALKYELLAGIIGYEQDQDTLALRPQMGWAVRSAEQARQKQFPW